MGNPFPFGNLFDRALAILLRIPSTVCLEFSRDSFQFKSVIPYKLIRFFKDFFFNNSFGNCLGYSFGKFSGNLFEFLRQFLRHIPGYFLRQSLCKFLQPFFWESFRQILWKFTNFLSKLQLTCKCSCQKWNFKKNCRIIYQKKSRRVLKEASREVTNKFWKKFPIKY